MNPEMGTEITKRIREVDVVVVWQLRRWGRSLPDFVKALRQPTGVGVGFRRGASPSTDGKRSRGQQRAAS
jgi:DNA invertase Pin-like site-specific DNA recombinase